MGERERGSARRRAQGAAALRAAVLSFCLALFVAEPAAAQPLIPVIPPRAAPPTASVPPPAGALPPDTLYLAQTGHYVSDAFLTYWRDGGGGRRFGFPLSERYEELGADGVRRPVQLFEKARFELHTAAGSNPLGGDARATVELGLLGRELLGARDYPPVAHFATTPQREYIAATGHSLGLGFRDFWHANDGPRLLGWPISEELPSGARTVQWFERGRLEFDPAAPAGARVSMSSLGTTLLVKRRWPRPTRIALSLVQPAPGQGMTTVAELFTDRPVTVLAARFDDRPVNFFGAGSYHRALVGVPPSEPAGPHTLTVELREAGGTVKTVAQEVVVRDTPFPRDRVYLPPDQDELLDPTVAERELRTVAPLFALVTPERRWRGPFVVPAAGPVTTEFGEMRAYNDGPFASWHNGMDIGAPAGAPVVAPAPGRVVFVDRLAIRGNFVALDHGLGVVTHYFHLSETTVVPGHELAAGELLGRVGTTGLSTGPHLHWEVRVGGVPVSPVQWMEGEVLP